MLFYVQTAMGEEGMMGRVTINQNMGISTTALSNIFIDEYMADANDAEIKVYLYLLRMMCANEATSVSDLADKFNYTEKDVHRALTYWENQGLISLEISESGHLTGIHMQDIEPRKGAAIRSLNAVSTLPKYSVVKKEEKKVVKHKENPQMLFVAEQYFGRTLNSNEIKTIYYIQDELEFSEDLIDYLLQHCASAGKKDFDYVRKVAISWHEKGIKTPEEAAMDNSAHKVAYSIMRELGMTNAPTNVELRYFERWQNEYKFTLSIILEACKRTVLQTQTKRLQYCDGILRKWNQSGVQTIEDIKKLDAAHGKTLQFSDASTGKPAKYASLFNQFEQNDYNLDSLEKQLLDN